MCACVWGWVGVCVSVCVMCVCVCMRVCVCACVCVWVCEHVCANCMCVGTSQLSHSSLSNHFLPAESLPSVLVGKFSSVKQREKKRREDV